MFKIGEEVVCIDDSYDNSVLNFGQDTGLTIGKKYRICATYIWGGVLVGNDRNEPISLMNDRFITIEESRKLKIKKLCSKIHQ